MARLFTAVDLGPETRRLIAAEQSALARVLTSSRGERLRLVRPPELHLTLVFIGEVADERMPVLVDAMNADIGMPAFDVEFGSCGVFPPEGPARVLWLGVRRGATELVRLFDLVADRLATAGIPRERRPFAPHLTLGRWRERGPSRVRLQLPEVGRVAVEHVSSVTLFHSRLLPGGPEHTAIARARLAAKL
jgi:2'-5' RNA ligase